MNEVRILLLISHIVSSSLHCPTITGDDKATLYQSERADSSSITTGNHPSSSIMQDANRAEMLIDFACPASWHDLWANKIAVIEKCACLFSFFGSGLIPLMYVLSMMMIITLRKRRRRRRRKRKQSRQMDNGKVS